MKLRKILLIIPKNTPGGAERVMSQLANQFVRQGINVTLLNFDTNSAFYELDSKVNNVKMGMEYRGKDFMKALRIFHLEIKRFRFIHKTIKELQPDVVLPFLEMAELLTIPNCIITGTPFCVSLRNDYNRYFRYMKILARLTYKKARLVVCQTENVEKTLLTSIKCNTTVIPNPIDSTTYTNEYVNVLDRRKVIINVGRLTEQKNQMLLIKAFSKVLIAHPQYELHIYGTGHLKEKLEEEVRLLGLNNKVFLKGVLHNAILKNKDAALFVMSSDYEGFPNTLVEAMANGIPSLSSDFNTGAARQVLKDGEFGYLFKVGDVNDLEKQINAILENPFEAENKAIKGKYIISELNAKNICNQWVRQIENNL